MIGAAPASPTQFERAPALAYMKGLAMHLTNPKPIFFFGSFNTAGISPETSHADLALVAALVAAQATFIFLGNAWLFSSARVAAAYKRLRRWCEATYALHFAGASIRVLASSL